MVEKVRALGPLHVEVPAERFAEDDGGGGGAMTDKPKVAFYWCASCGGCEEAVVDLAEKILDVVAAVDIVFWPVALDFKRHDVEAMADGSHRSPRSSTARSAPPSRRRWRTCCAARPRC